eukprot:UN09329
MSSNLHHVLELTAVMMILHKFVVLQQTPLFQGAGYGSILMQAIEND